MRIAGTGHRPEDSEDEEIVREKIRRALNSVIVTRPTIITGMAAGYDLWLADEAIALDLPVWAAKPWAGHSARVGDRALYAHVIENASEVVNVFPATEYPGPWVYHRRNQWMVDHATNVLAYWSGTQKGGTYACITYAKSKSQPIRNIYHD